MLMPTVWPYYLNSGGRFTRGVVIKRRSAASESDLMACDTLKFKHLFHAVMSTKRILYHGIDAVTAAAELHLTLSTSFQNMRNISRRQ